jgi:hypothetical protein
MAQGNSFEVVLFPNISLTAFTVIQTNVGNDLARGLAIIFGLYHSGLFSHIFAPQGRAGRMPKRVPPSDLGHDLRPSKVAVDRMRWDQSSLSELEYTTEIDLSR